MTAILEKQLMQKSLPSERAALRSYASVGRGSVTLQHGLILTKAEKERRRQIGDKLVLPQVNAVAKSPL
jgi:hypothetical protein